jgi:hypothetical protein
MGRNVRASPASALSDNGIAAQKQDHVMQITVELPEDIAARSATRPGCKYMRS